MAAHQLRFTPRAKEDLEAIKDARKLKKVRRALGLIQTDPRHPGLHSHKYESLRGHTDVWESYVENKTPSAWRIFWQYGPTAGVITIVMISPHP